MDQYVTEQSGMCEAGRDFPLPALLDTSFMVLVLLVAAAGVLADAFRLSLRSTLENPTIGGM